MGRSASLKRETGETTVEISVNLDGNGEYRVDTPVAFLNHMLELFSKHSGIDLEVYAAGDVEVDFHHTVEDIGITLGECLNGALGDRRGINRYGFFILPMDETLARVVIDLGGRPFLVFNAEFSSPRVGNFDVELVEEFFRGLTNHLKCNLHIDLLRGGNTHHSVEAIFKAFARALKEAIRITGDDIPSSKGVIET